MKILRSQNFEFIYSGYIRILMSDIIALLLSLENFLKISIHYLIYNTVEPR